MRSVRIPGIGALFVVALGVTSCSSPDSEKVRHLERGDQYAAEKRDEFAAVEYARAVQLDERFGEARYKLAQTYERMNNLAAAFPEYVRAADALPGNRDAQIKATQVLLVSRRFEDANARVTALIEKDPKDIEALLLRANAIAGLQDASGAISQIEEALAVSPGDSRAFLSLGSVRMQTGQVKEAEAAFRQALTLDPASIQARLAFANFLSTIGRAPEAEAAIKEALAQDPRNLLAHRMLGVLYLATQRPKEAEQPLKAVAEISQAPQARLQLADYYIGVGRTKEARGLLTMLSAEQGTSDQAASLEAETRLAAIDYAQGRTTEAHKRLDALLARVPKHVRSLVMKAEWLATENKLDEALERARAAVAADPQSSEAHFALATVQERRGEIADAIKSYNEVTRLNPRADRALVALSRLNLNRDRGLALQQAEEARRAAPSNGDARVALVRTLLAMGNLPRAETEIAELLKAAPDNGGVHALLGTLQAARRDNVAARGAYERALSLSPGLFDALAGLTYLDLQAKTPAQAIPRLEAQIAREPANPRLLALAAQAFIGAGDQAKAEQALRRAVSVDPNFTPGYEQLARLYVQQGQLDRARAEFEGMARRDSSAVGAKTMVGMLLEAQGKRDDARKWYEGVVNGPAPAPVAANNLAFIYAEEGVNLDIALQLATSAKSSLPQDPNVDDTIGWVYYKKDLPMLAVEPLQESLRKRPDNAEVLYHLGLTYAKLGTQDKAREALTRALKIDPTVGGAEARRALASVSQ